MIRRIQHNMYRLYSHSGRNLGTFSTKEAAVKHERDVNFFKYKAKHMSEFK
jgi:hypothetical protein